MSYTHTMTITTDEPVDEKGVQAFIDACGYLMTGYLGADAVIHATWNGTNEPVTQRQVEAFDVVPADEFESVGALAGEVRNDPFAGLFGDDE